jgi:hypothetical protein
MSNTSSAYERLKEFQTEHNATTKGPLALLIQQFLSTNINEHSLFNDSARNVKLANIIEKYNAIINETETDPSLRIEFDAKG